MKALDYAEKSEYLKKHVFHGLVDMNDGFDAGSICYFSETQFEAVLDRVEKLGIAVHGIEPWLNGHFYDVKTVERYGNDPTDPTWYRQAFAEFKERGVEGLLYGASFGVYVR